MTEDQVTVGSYNQKDDTRFTPISEHLRDKIAALLCEWEEDGEPSSKVFAERVLALPEIAEALANERCACGEPALYHEGSGCSAFNNTCD
jgi:hypothetical protein